MHISNFPGTDLTFDIFLGCVGVAFEPSVPELIEIFSGTVGFVGGNRCSADAMSRCTDPLR